MAALLGGAAIVSGQIELAVIQGTVVDQFGAPIEGVMVRIRDTARGGETVLKSDENGRFYRRGLRAVEYDLAVEKDGYQPIADRVRLNAGTDRRLSFTLARAAPEGAEEFAQGVEAYNRGDNETAALAFEAALASAPGVPEIRVNLALTYLRLSRTAEAVVQLETAASLTPDDPRVLLQLGGAYVDTNDLDKAIAAFEKGLGSQPDLAQDALAYDAVVTLGAAYFAKGDDDTAQAQFDKALAVRPGAPLAALGLAKVLVSRGEVDQALQLFQEVVASVPGSPEAAEAAAFIQEIEKTQNP